MTYIGLATKYRPKKFQQIIGQPNTAIVKELFRDASSIPPLVLFCGPSGVGKTTIARVIAAAVNCKERDDSGEPCGSCADCSATFSDKHINVYEIDAASYGTADALRDLISKAHMNSLGVNTFIIDEAQSISAQGWNVLLKTFEEPPPNCLFILLTSEPRKVPSKIRTRALSFYFKHVAPKVIKNYLTLLSTKTGIGITENDINVIVDCCEGSLRNAFMMVEQCVLSEFTAADLFSNRDMSVDYLVSIVKKDYTMSLSLVEAWWGEVGDAKTILSQLADTLEKIALHKSGIELYSGSSQIKALADTLDIDLIAACLEQLSEWFSIVIAKAQLVLLTSKLYKAINGSSTSITNKTSNQPLPTSAEKQETVPSLRESLSGF